MTGLNNRFTNQGLITAGRHRITIQGTVFLLCLLLVLFRWLVPPVSGLSWDVFGYYLYLPAKFIYHDIGLGHQEWLQDLMNRYHPSSTLYQIIGTENGGLVIKYSMGLAILYAPFFFLANVMAGILGYPTDGLSMPYQYIMAAGGIIYAAIGLIFLARILRVYFNPSLSTLLLILVVAGTNYFQLTAFDGTLLPHNFLFTLYALLVYYTIRWHIKPLMRYAVITGIVCGFIILIRPAEVVCLLIPLLWTVTDRKSLCEKIQLIRHHYLQVIMVIVCIIMVFIPQMIYWKTLTGHYLFFSYRNPGEGFRFLAPYTLKFLFSFRKGWFIYTPLMIFSLLGFYYLFRMNRSIFYAVMVFFIADLYVISSWSNWWYAGGSFSSRSLVPAYVLLSLPLGYFIRRLQTVKRTIRSAVVMVMLFFVVLNLFQTWQFESGIIDKERMTRAYYFAVFGRTSVSEQDKKLLLIDRSTDTNEPFVNEQDYTVKVIYQNHFNNESVYIPVGDTSGVCILDGEHHFSTGPDVRYRDLTRYDHAWIRASVKIFIPDNYRDKWPLLVMAFHHNNKAYKYRTAGLDSTTVIRGAWNKITMDYLTPEVFSRDDDLKVYVWHRGKVPVALDDMLVKVFEPKKP